MDGAPDGSTHNTIIYPLMEGTIGAFLSYRNSKRRIL